MNKETKLTVIKLGFAVAAACAAYFIKMPNTASVMLCFFGFFIAGFNIVYKAICNIFKGEFFDENTLMSIASVCAFILGEHIEAMAVVVLFEIGELILDGAVDKSRKNVEGLISLMPENATLFENGQEITAAAKDVKVGQTVCYKPGERIAFDGEVVYGTTNINAAAVTGESIPKSVSDKDTVLAGSIVLDGNIRIKVTNSFDNSTVAKMLEIVENENHKKAKTERFITRFARHYTPIIVIMAVLLAVIPPLFTGEWGKWIYKGLAFTVVSCPCALVISVPLGFFCGIGAASKKGILIKGSGVIEKSARIDTAVFDKTGTLTNGEFYISEVHPSSNVTNDTLINIAASVEKYSTHPIARCIAKYGKKTVDADNVKELAGMGICAVIMGKRVLAGNAKLMAKNGIGACDNGGVHIAIDKQYLGYITVADKLKDNVENIAEAFNKVGINNIYVLTGDNSKNTNHIKSIKGINGVYAELLPNEKVEKLKEIKKNSRGVIFVGDGINDAPVIAAADVGASMGDSGSDIAVDSADIVLMGDNPLKAAFAKQTAMRTMRTVKQNVVICLALKLAVLLLTAFGVAGMWAAVAADVGVMLMAVLNSVRILAVR